MQKIKVVLALLLTGFLFGCATVPQPPVALDKSYWNSNKPNLGVYVQNADVPQFYMEGDVRLLDFVVIKAVMAPASNHFEKLDLADFDVLRTDIKTRFEKESIEVKLLSEDLKMDDLPDYSDPDDKDQVYFARKDYSKIRDKHAIDHLLIIEPKRVGLARPYHAFMPLGDPRAIFEVRGQLVDLHSNKLIWYADISRSGYSSGEWDEPPVFPGLTNAFYVALEGVKEDVMEHLMEENITQAKLD